MGLFGSSKPSSNNQRFSHNRQPVTPHGPNSKASDDYQRCSTSRFVKQQDSLPYLQVPPRRVVTGVRARTGQITSNTRDRAFAHEVAPIGAGVGDVPDAEVEEVIPMRRGNNGAPGTRDIPARSGVVPAPSRPEVAVAPLVDHRIHANARRVLQTAANGAGSSLVESATGWLRAKVVDQLHGLRNAFSIGRCWPSLLIPAMVLTYQHTTHIHNYSVASFDAATRLEVHSAALDARLSVVENYIKSPSPCTFSTDPLAPDVTPCHIRHAVANAINDAIRLHSRDTIGYRDFASLGGGAIDLPHLTSPTYRSEALQSRLSIPVIRSWFTRADDYTHLPATALHDDISPGSCWDFAGYQGQLGVALSEEVHIDNVTIDHLAAPLASQSEIASAPRDIVLWGRVEDKNLDLARSLPQAALLSPLTRPADPSPDALYIALASFTYNIHAAFHVQTFPVFADIRSLDMGFKTVVFQVNDNWGSNKSTCIYRVRVHGRSLPLAAAERRLNSL